MIQSPIQLPRSPLKFDAASAGSLAPKELKEHDQQPNPNVDRSGIREAIDSVGRPIGQANLGTIIVGFILISMGVMAMFFTITHAVLLFVLFPGAEGTVGGIPIASIVIGLAALVFIFIGVMLVRGRWGASTRLRTAWTNGWIEYRPALIGELTYRRRVDYDDSTDFYYTAPVLILQPDGSLTKSMTEEFIAPNPNWLKLRGRLLADGPLVATVDFNHNNGWGVVGYRADADNPQPELHNGLRQKNIEAALSFAERNWVRS
ncbi:hypothetical protein ACUY2G_03880 [Corynebacterium guaraldiae]